MASGAWCRIAGLRIRWCVPPTDCSGSSSICAVSSEWLTSTYCFAVKHYKQTSTTWTKIIILFFQTFWWDLKLVWRISGFIGIYTVNYRFSPFSVLIIFREEIDCGVRHEHSESGEKSGITLCSHKQDSSKVENNISVNTRLLRKRYGTDVQR